MKKKQQKEQQKQFTKKEKLINFYTIGLMSIALILFALQAFYAGRKDHSSDNYYSSLPATSDTIPHSKVCMVDDIYQGTYPTIAVSITNRPYFSCDQKGVYTLNTDPKKRMAIDPVSKKLVDKASAVIAIDPKKDGSVMYFESHSTHSKYVDSLQENTHNTSH
jgi:hypothetical protein